MKLSNKKGWQVFVYQLIYPAILGSMLYDIFDFSHPWNVKHFAKLVVTLLYCLDYLHLFADLKAPTSKRCRTFELVVDAGAAFFFRGVFSALSVDAPLLAIILMALIAVAFTGYNLSRGTRPAGALLLIASWLLISAFVLSCVSTWRMELFLASSLVTLALSVHYVFVIYGSQR